MGAAKPKQSEQDLSQFLGEFSFQYLRQYWPETAQSAVGWADNAVLMLAYQESALALRQYFARTAKTLDISTGPALAPLLAMLPAVAEIQLSDFQEENRICLEESEIEYWQHYVPMLVKTFISPERQIAEILGQLDFLRRKTKPLHVDLFAPNPFFGAVNYSDYELFTMHFVADGITETKEDYFKCLGKVTDMMQAGTALSMSAIVDSDGWWLGDKKLPSPKVSEQEILDFFKAQGMEILRLDRSMRLDHLTYTGGWIVVTAVKPLR